MKAVISSISILANKKAILLYFVLIPVTNILLLLFLNAQFGVTSNLKVLIASVIITSASHVISIFSSSFVYDCNIGVDRDVLSKGYFSMYYWILKVIISFSVGLILATINLLIILLITNDIELIRTSFVILILVLIFSVILAILVSLASWGQSNPYFWSNIVNAFIYPLSGVVVYYALYPPIFNKITYILPFARTIGLISNSNSNFMYDIFLTLGYAVLIIILYQYKKRKIYNSSRKYLL